jgi:hypothetical protein
MNLCESKELVRQRVRQCVAVKWLCVCGTQCARQCVAVCGGVWQCVAVRAARCGSALYVCIHKFAHNLYWCAPIGMRWD